MATKMHKTITAKELQDGNLLQCGVSTTYVLVAKAEPNEDGRIAVTLYDGATPYEKPTLFFKPGDKVSLSLRGPVV